MIFNTWQFAVFAAPFFLIYWLLPRRYRNPSLIAGGIVFYSVSSLAYTLLIVSLATATFLIARAMAGLPKGNRTARRLLLAFGVSLSLGALGIFKYANLFVDSVRSAVPLLHLAHVQWVVPLALSFFTFEFIHFLVDVYLGKIESVGARSFAEFALFFPTLVAGPIKRYQNFEPQSKTIERPHSLVAAANVYRIFLGLAKKMIVADSMTPLTAPLLAPDPLFGHLDYWIAMLAYTTKIYFDFTGYSDIAIGLAGLMGFSILENFDRPYWSRNISEFWRRWHISLSSWIRDYAFIPLGGSRQGKIRTLFNLTAVMAVAGLWHGAAWHFVGWGLWHGAGLGAHRAWETTALGERLSKISGARWLSTALTFLFVAFGWVLFCCPTFDAAWKSFEELLGARAF
jgi:alginate O-acetyltransferase complex protein AlgI